MSYWTNSGKYQEAYDVLYDKLVPARGRAATPHGELLRVFSRIYYHFYNDGDDTARAIVEAGRAEYSELEAPADAPGEVQAFMCDLRGDYDSSAKNSRFVLDEDLLETVADAVIEYAQQQQVDRTEPS